MTLILFNHGRSLFSNPCHIILFFKSTQYSERALQRYKSSPNVRFDVVDYFPRRCPPKYVRCANELESASPPATLGL